jgi:hypothetical protein
MLPPGLHWVPAEQLVQTPALLQTPVIVPWVHGVPGETGVV